MWLQVINYHAEIFWRCYVCCTAQAQMPCWVETVRDYSWVCVLQATFGNGTEVHVGVCVCCMWYAVRGPLPNVFVSCEATVSAIHQPVVYCSAAATEARHE